MKRAVAVFVEALMTARSQPIASVVSVVMIAGMCATVILTTGRTVGAEQSVLQTIDSSGTRSIIVRADSDAGLEPSVVRRITSLSGVEWVGAFGEARDSTNAQVLDGTKVPVRKVWSSDLGAFGGSTAEAGRSDAAWASPEALLQLGMVDGVGGVSIPSGPSYAILGAIVTPDYLSFLEPLAVAPQSSEKESGESVSVLVVIAGRPDLVGPLSRAVASSLALEDPSKANITTSEELATLRGLVQGQLGEFSRSLVVVVFGLTAVLVAAILYGLVMLRRKDFGRRRALGASRGLIIILLLIQMAALSALGAIVGTAGATLGLIVGGDPLPDVGFFAALSVLAMAVGTGAALMPALAASRRDPLKELRVP